MKFVLILFVSIPLVTIQAVEPVIDGTHIAITQANGVISDIDRALDYVEQALQTKENVDQTFEQIFQNEQISDMRAVMGDARKLGVRIDRLNERTLDLYEEAMTYNASEIDGDFLLKEIMKRKYDRKIGEYDEDAKQLKRPDDPFALSKSAQNAADGVDGDLGKELSDERNKIAQSASDRAQEVTTTPQTQVSLQRHNIAMMNELIQLLNAQATEQKLNAIADQKVRDFEIKAIKTKEAEQQKQEALGASQSTEQLKTFESKVDSDFDDFFNTIENK